MAKSSSPLRKAVTIREHVYVLLEAVALGTWLSNAYTSECMYGLATTPISQRLGRSGEWRGWSTTPVTSKVTSLG